LLKYALPLAKFAEAHDCIMATTKLIAIRRQLDMEVAEDAEAAGAGASAGHSLTSLTPYKHAFVVVAAAFEELHP